MKSGFQGTGSLKRMFNLSAFDTFHIKYSFLDFMDTNPTKSSEEKV